jgi:predicted nucleic acid-binding protein
VPVAVVDASAVAAILFGEASAEQIVKQVGSRALAAPSLLPYELASVADGKVRRSELSAEAATVALRAYSLLQIALHDPDLLEVFRIAVRGRLTASDAAYLWLARSLSANLVTLDQKLAKAWVKLGT